ncbi:MAG: FtsX-like permease family protein [Bacillota bacterium]|nr:FtsX-like permease family protein [Bacillota bacterium]
MLKRKMLRDLKENKLAYIACLVIIAIGLMIFTSVSMVMENLYSARDIFYEEARFADGFARVNSMPAGDINRLSDIEGVSEIEGRLVKDVRVLFPGSERNVYLRLVSLPEGKSSPINTPVLIEGAPLSEKSRNLWVCPSFFEAQNFELGYEIPLLIEGRSIPFAIVGTAQSPEFVYAMRTAQEMYPMPETFGIGYLPFSMMKTLFQERDQVNDLVFLLEPGYSYEEVEERLKPRLGRYGLISIFSREDQMSHAILTMELQGLEGSSTAMPILFLGIAGVILYILLMRMVEQQRGQIGTLKAFGYTGRELLFHYLSYALILGFIGGMVGGLLGIWLSFPYTEMYRDFFQLPGLESTFSLKYLVLGILLSLFFSVLAGYFGCRNSLKLQPAEAMRPPAPPPARRTWLERWDFFWNLLTVQGKMSVRNLFRNKQRSFFTLIGVMFAFSMMAVTWYFNSIVDILIYDQFEKVQTHNVRVTFSRPLSLKEVERELRRLPGMKRVEPIVEVPVTLKHRWQEKDTIIMGLGEDAFLYNILTDQGERISPPERGIILTERLSDELNAPVGTELTLESYWIRESRSVKVVDVIPQYLGTNAYMEINALNKYLGHGSLATSALLAVEDDSIPFFRERYLNAQPVASIEESGALIEKFNELMESFGAMQYIFTVFGFIIGFAIIYNSSIVSLSERKRELASLKVMGMTSGEVLQVLTFEQWLVSLSGMLVGIPFTIVLMNAMSRAFESDLYSIPVQTEGQFFMMAFLGTAFSILIAQWTIAKRISQLSLVEVLKERD